MKPVEEVTALAERVKRPISPGACGFRRAARNSTVDRGHQFALERLESAFRAQKRLIADAAHELKTPTAVLVGEAQEALRPEASSEERRESLATIERVSRGLAREVDSLLHLARGDGALPVRRGVVDLAMIAAEAVDTTEPLGAPRHVRCVFSHNGPALLTGDR